VRYGGELQAYKALASADMYRQKAAYVLSAGAATAGTLTRTSVLSSALSVYNLWNTYGLQQKPAAGTGLNMPGMITLPNTRITDYRG